MHSEKGCGELQDLLLNLKLGYFPSNAGQCVNHYVCLVNYVTFLTLFTNRKGDLELPLF